MAYDVAPLVYAHIQLVQRNLNKCIRSLLQRSADHDQSKLVEPEKSYHDTYTPQLEAAGFGTPEYARLKELAKPAIDHHFACSRHHPEHFVNGIKGMNLLDLVEMVCDWRAAAARNPNGDVRRSAELLQSQYGYSDELRQIIINTLDFLDEKPESPNEQI